MTRAFPSPWALLATAALLSCGGEIQRVTQTPVPPPPSPPPAAALTEVIAAGPSAAQREPAAPATEATEEFQSASQIAELANLERQDLPLDEPQDGDPDEESNADPAAGLAENAGEGEVRADEEAEKALIDEIAEINVPEEFNLPENRASMLTVTDSELPLVLNDEVKKYINYFSGRRGKMTFRSTMRRAGAYREMIERVLREEGVPVEIFHLAQAESGFKPKARSYASAVGMWQFMSFRGRQYGLRQNNYLDERHDPEQATRAAARHLLDLYVEFDDWYLAMAAYNSGPLRVRRAIERGGSRDFWTLSKKRLLPRQTRNYVPIIVAMAYIGKNEHLYLDEETDLDPAPPMRYDTVRTDSEIHLSLVADITDTTIEALAEMNPALHRSATPPVSYALRIPEGSAETFLNEIALIPPDKRMAWRRHTVTEGETLESIAKRYNISKADLFSVLDETSPEPFAEGARLTIPAPAQKIVTYQSHRGAGGLVEGGTGRYRIARGDTLGSIARRFGTSVSQLKSWNGLSTTRIRAGRYLIVRQPGSGDSEVASNRPASPVASRSISGEKIRYKIRPGDSLGKIAARHGVSVSELKSWNGLRGNTIVAGHYLTVGSRTAASSPASGASRAPEAASARTPNVAPGGKYRIRNGDTLGVISERFGVSVGELKSWNGLRSSSIRAGQTLIVRPAASGSEPAVAEADSGLRSGGAEEEPVRVAARQPSPAGATEYKIRRGDSLAAIASKFGVTIGDLQSWNSLRGSRITAGDTLIVRAPAPAAGNSLAGKQPAYASAAMTEGSAQRYQIRRGDTLAVIASRFGVTVRQLMDWNGLRNTRITAGEYLLVRETVQGGG